MNERTRIGLIELSTSIALSVEAPQAMPNGAIALFSRLRLPRGGECTAEALDEMTSSTGFEEAARQLADAEVAAIAFACTTGSLLHGEGYDAQLAARLHGATGIPSTTTATALLESLRALDVRRLVIATPYVDDLNRREQVFLEAAGFEVLAIRGLGLRVDASIARVEPAEIEELVASVVDPDADAIFLSCTNLLTFDVLDRLEERYGLPVISSNAATLWWTLALAGLRPTADGLGRLLSGAIAPVAA